MKNRVSFFLSVMILLIGGIGSTHAQRPVGDTLTSFRDDTTYYIGGYEWSLIPDPSEWFVMPVNNDIHTLGHSRPHSCFGSTAAESCYDAERYIEGVQMTTSRPLKILGVAVCAYAEELGNGYHSHVRLDNVLDTSLTGRNTDSLILYKLTPAGPQMLTGGPWRVEWPHRYMVLPRYDTVEWQCTQLDHPELLPRPVASLYEVMFDKPQVVTDSFIVAGTTNNNHSVEVMVDEYHSRCFWEHRPTRHWIVRTFVDYANENQVDWIWPSWEGIWHRHCWSCRATLGGFYWRYFPLIVPIIDPDFDTTLCDEVSDVRVADSTDTTLTLMWNGGNAVEWEVEYFEMNTPTVLRVTTRVPMVTLTGLRERTNYMARVRGMCEWDTEYGEWSGWLDVYTGVHHDDPPQSVGNLERFTQMMPNPARGEVTVLSSYRLSRVVVYDLGGRAVLEQEDDGLATTLDVSGLAKGVYVVAIHTPAGIATKRLVVEN